MSLSLEDLKKLKRKTKIRCVSSTNILKRGEIYTVHSIIEDLIYLYELEKGFFYFRFELVTSQRSFKNWCENVYK